MQKSNQKKGIPANKDKKHLIQPGEEHLVHLRVTERAATKDPLKFIDTDKVIIMSQADFEIHKKHQQLFNHVKAEIVHDPTLVEEKPGKDGKDAEDGKGAKE